MVSVCEFLCEREKHWLLSQCWILGEDMDDDVEDEQKCCAAAMVLARALVEKGKEMAAKGSEEIKVPQMPLHEARHIVTRSHSIQYHDYINIFIIDSNKMVPADSVGMQNAFRDICNGETFDKHLRATLERLDKIESLGRTREITFKDLQNNGTYQMAISRRDHTDDVHITVGAD